MTTPNPPPEALLIEARRKASRPKLSAREASRRADISEGRWRQIAKGYTSVGGLHAPVVAPADTLARMARVVEITPDELRSVERNDAALELEYIEQIEHISQPAASAGSRSPLSGFSDVELAQELLNRMVIRQHGSPTNPLDDLDRDDDGEPPYGLAARPRRVPPIE